MFLFCAAAALTWILVASRMTPPRYLANMLISLSHLDEAKANELGDAMLDITGIAEVTLNFADGVAFLKVDNQQLDKLALQNLLDKYI